MLHTFKFLTDLYRGQPQLKKERLWLMRAYFWTLKFTSFLIITTRNQSSSQRPCPFNMLIIVSQTNATRMIT